MSLFTNSNELLDKHFNKDDLLSSTAWPFEEAKKILKKIEGKTPKKGYVLFETGYGPSGLPHIGTFGEVVRTNFVRFAFSILAPEIPTKLICVSDDYDGMRKVPENVPNREMLQNYIGMPLTSIPDPFGIDKSYGHYMNAKLKSFLDSFGFEYEFCSATEKYHDGSFNETIKMVLNKYQDLMDLMLPTLGEDRRATYSPIMPKSPKTGKILQDGVISIDAVNGTVKFKDEDGTIVDASVYNGGCKLQWKIDFGARWRAFDVDYEIFGKDHMPNEEIYRKVCKILGGNPPVNYWYELFLGEDGDKISKSKGNGISVEEWLKYAPSESMSLFMYQKPKTAKRLFFDVIPKNVDEYIQYNASCNDQSGKDLLNNPAFFVNFGKIIKQDFNGITFSLLLNLASACNPESDDVLWGFIEKYSPNLCKNKFKMLDKMVDSSINYYNSFIKPNKKFKTPTETEAYLFKSLFDTINSLDDSTTGSSDYQNSVYKVSRDAGVEPKEWFALIYNVLLGQNEGPRVGSFIKIFGKENFLSLIKSKALH